MTFEEVDFICTEACTKLWYQLFFKLIREAQLHTIGFFLCKVIELKKIVTEKLLILLTQAFLRRGYWEQVQKDSTFKITKNYHTKLKLAGL